MWDFGRNKYFNFPEERDRSPHLAIRSGKWKLLTNSDGTSVELYDMEPDRNETANIATQNPKITKKLSQKLRAWYFENR